jgi:L-2-hydroxyglutarate oxidase LhgO
MAIGERILIVGGGIAGLTLATALAGPSKALTSLPSTRSFAPRHSNLDWLRPSP